MAPDIYIAVHKASVIPPKYKKSPSTILLLKPSRKKPPRPESAWHDVPRRVSQWHDVSTPLAPAIYIPVHKCPTYEGVLGCISPRFSLQIETIFAREAWECVRWHGSTWHGVGWRVRWHDIGYLCNVSQLFTQNEWFNRLNVSSDVAWRVQIQK